MSGIVGIVSPNGCSPADAHAATLMISGLTHRSPDGISSWGDECAQLRHGWHNTTGTRDFAVNLAGGHRLVLAGDIRLDNRAELARELGSSANAPDVDLVLNAYRKWGAACVEHLLGDFAFALWNPTEHELFCARDHLGVRPFHYCETDRSLVFSSEIRPLLLAGIVDRSVDEDYVSLFLAGMPAEEETTAIAGVKRLAPGHFLKWTRQGLSMRRYWSPRVSAAPKGAFADRFRDLFLTSVSDRMRGPGPLGALLSGGLDSSSICGAVTSLRLGRGLPPIKTFSATFPGQAEMDERAFIDAVLRKDGLEPNFVDITPEESFSRFELLMAQQEGVVLAPGLTVTHRLYSAAAKSGVSVLLDGHGGDEVVSHGDRRIYELAAQGRWWTLWKEMGGIAKVRKVPVFGTYLALLDHYAAGGSLSRLLPSARPTDTPMIWRNFILKDFANRTSLAERFRAKASMPPGASTDDRLYHQWRMSSPLVSHAFETLNKLAAAAGIEVRFPFFDRRLVEFCLALPGDARLSEGWSRFVLRTAMKDILPPEVQWRPGKVDFTPNLVRSIVKARASIESLLRDDNGLGDFVDLKKLGLVVDRMAGATTQVQGYEVQFVWRAVSLGYWLRGVAAGRSL